MPAAYISQLINLTVAILMVPLLLRYLDVGGFVIWSIFTTFGGFALQIENAIQTVSVREIAREYHSGNATELLGAIKKSKKAYLFLAGLMLFPVLIVGLVYLNFFAVDKIGDHGVEEWFVFVSAYAVNYYFGSNNSILLGMRKVVLFSNINSFSRSLNFSVTYLMLHSGYSVLGVCLSFMFSVIIGCSFLLFFARKSVNEFCSSRPTITGGGRGGKYEKSANIVAQTTYMFASFFLYKAGLLVAAIIFSKEITGAFGLALQANTMLTMLALVPVQVWLHRLVEAVTSENPVRVVRELIRTVVISNIVFMLGSVFLIFVGDFLLGLIGSKIAFPNNQNMVLISVAFLIELNIYLFVSFLLIKSNYKFVRFYVVISLVGVAGAVVHTVLTQSNIGTLVVIPLILQAIVCLPYVFKIVCNELAITPKKFFSYVGSVVVARA